MQVPGAICRRNNLKLRKDIISDRFLWDRNIFSTLRKRYSIGATSHKSSQLQQFPNDAVFRMMQYLKCSIFLSNFRRY